MSKLLKVIFFAVLVRPIVFVLLGLNIRRRDRLPKKGPAILVANHNSHLDTIVLMSLFPIGEPEVKPVAAADYWLRNRRIAWFAREIIGIIPIARTKTDATTDVLAPISEALARGEVVIFFPEGTRGEPERLGHFKSGIARLAQRHPDVPVIPIFLHGLGKALPRGEGLLVPFACDVWVGDAVYGKDAANFLPTLESRVVELADQAKVPAWE